MARNLAEIKECLRMFSDICSDYKSLEYKGTPDPLRGDEIYRRVRDAAKVTKNQIFNAVLQSIGCS